MMLGGLGELCDVELDVQLFVGVCCVQRVGASAFCCASRPMLLSTSVPVYIAFVCFE